jgi:UDPglucose 6-dehydrogenase
MTAPVLPGPTRTASTTHGAASPDESTQHGPSGKRIAVIGCGHVGVVTAAGLAKLGHVVIGVDRDPARVEELRAGQVPFHEAGLTDLVHAAVGSGQLEFTTSYKDAVETAEFIFLAVDTPSTLAGAADLRNIRSATASIAASLNGTSPIIVNKSTSPIGTGDTIDGILSAALLERARRPRIVSNPEFLRQGHAVEDFFHPDRIVIGARDREDGEAVAALYAHLDAPVVLTDVRTAEMIKYAANSFLATKISFINEVARLCEPLAIDVGEVVAGVSLDPRIGPDFLQPGIGFGGSCLPKDVAALRYVGETFGVATPVLSAVQAVNQSQRALPVRWLRARLGGLEGRTIAVWGATFKGDTEDLRDSPAMDVIHLLLNDGAQVRLFDPVIEPGTRSVAGATVCSSPLDAATGADALAVLTDWAEFGDVPLADVRAVLRHAVLFDGRNTLSKADAEQAGFLYAGVGRVPSAHRRRLTDR